MISDRLPIPSHIALALACKSLFTSLYPTAKFPSLSKEDLVDLLLCLERDISGQFLCFGCTRLRFFEPHHKLGWRGQKHQGCGDEMLRFWYHFDILRCHRTFSRMRRRYRGSEYAKVRLHSWRPVAEGPEIEFSEARLVMNRHLYGESHGLPITTLERNFSFERYIILENDGPIEDHFPIERHPPGRRHRTRLLQKSLLGAKTEPKWHDSERTFLDEIANTQFFCEPTQPVPQSMDSMVPWKFTHSYSAKIIDNELFAARFHSISGPSVSPDRFKSLIRSIKLPVCLHLHCFEALQSNLYQRWVSQISDLPPVLLDLQQMEIGPSRFCESCRFCFTDHTLSIQGGKGKEDWNLELATYHRLGSCRTLDDPIWCSLTDITRDTTRYNDCQGFGVGEIRGHWFQGDGEDVGEESRWA